MSEKDYGLRRRIAVVALNVPLGYRSKQLSDLLWETVGVNVDPRDISIKDSGQYSASAFVNIDVGSIVEFLNRNFEQMKLGNGPLRWEIKKWKEDSPLKVESISFSLPSGKAEYDKNGIRRL